MNDFFAEYSQRLSYILQKADFSTVSELALGLQAAWRDGRFVFLCGNGGSAGNAIHLANDFIYGIAKDQGLGLRVEALTANPSVITCLANDISYDEIFAQQLKVKAQSQDALVVLSGSGNSPNVIRALEAGNELGMKTFAILGFSGGKCKDIAQVSIHFPVDDMQIAEDLQLIVGHMCMQWLYANPAKRASS